MRRVLHLAYAVLLIVATSGAATAAADDGGADASATAAKSLDAGAAVDAADASVVRDLRLALLRETAARIAALMSEKLDVAIEPRTLFDISIEDDKAVDVEAARLTALLREIDSIGSTKAKQNRVNSFVRTPSAADAGPEAGSNSTATNDVVVESDPLRFQARIDLDRARLAFYVLQPTRRAELLLSHSKRQADAKPPPTEEEVRATEAEAERQKALKAARDARSEAERAVSEEHARLLAIAQEQTVFEKTLADRRQALTAGQEMALGWQRRARETREKSASNEAVDGSYDELRKDLKTARADLDHALDDLTSGSSAVPVAGANPLTEVLPDSIDASAVHEVRARVEKQAIELQQEEERLREERATQLLSEIDTLNHERLAMLPFLTATKRDAVTGFGEGGIDQASSELRQLTLIVRYHRHATTKWVLASLHAPTEQSSKIKISIGHTIVVLIEWLVAIAIFVWVRRRVPLLLAKGYRRAVQHDRQERLPAPSLPTRVLPFALDVHRPLEWLALALLLSWLLPATAQGLLEIQLVSVAVQWILGGALVVDVVNALAGNTAVSKQSDPSDRRTAARQGRTDRKNTPAAPTTTTAALRLRSLRLIGRVVVTFGLVLAITTRLVGQGTIYQWVLSTCWIASLPVVLLLVRWWREIVFTRAELARKKTAFELWVLANRKGWKSFFAATAGGAFLFARGAFRATRSWVGRFSTTRRVLAYLFRRELDKLSAEREEIATTPLTDEIFIALGPETSSDEWIGNEDLADQIKSLEERLQARRGGVVAVVGQRGMGKTTLLSRLRTMFAAEDTLLVDALSEGAARDLRAMSTTTARAVFVDDAQRFIQPIMGGLATFDELLGLASKHNSKTTWVFALDEVIWLFLKRARGGRPLFDDVIRLSPWREESIIELLQKRTKTVGIEPTFERLLEKLPASADEIDKQEALTRRASSYYRLLWDYAAGNPGVALHMWRRSLGVEAGGETQVKFFQAPDTEDLELLPDPAVFVLRAILQLAPAKADEIGQATMLYPADVADALRHAVSHGYVKERDGRFTITWAWFRPIVLFLQRRHLLGAAP